MDRYGNSARVRLLEKITRDGVRKVFIFKTNKRYKSDTVCGN